MPKPIRMLLEVEEVALGHVTNLLHRTPGVMRFDLLLGDTPVRNGAAANGHAKPAKQNSEDKKSPRKVAGDSMNAEKFLLGLLAKNHGSMTAKEVIAAFAKDGRAKTSAYTSAHSLKQEKIIAGKGAYKLTKKGRDKARYV